MARNDADFPALGAFIRKLRPTWPELVVRVGDVPEVNGDPVRLREVLVNLVTNVRQHSPQGASITLDAGRERRDDGEWVVVNVSDEVPGNAPELVPHLFNRFRRGGGTGGVGLGLYLSQRLVEAHEGTLTVETAIGKGSTFWMAIPASRR